VDLLLVASLVARASKNEKEEKIWQVIEICQKEYALNNEALADGKIAGATLFTLS
jgi:hypothetical protein